VFVLGSHASWLVNQWWVVSNKASLDQLVEVSSMVREVRLEPLAGKGKSSELFADNGEQFSRVRVAEGDLGSIGNSHVMTALSLSTDVTFSGRSEGLNSILLSLLHLRSVSSFNNMDTLSSVNNVGLHRVTR
jgi:hypothetical protein